MIKQYLRCYINYEQDNWIKLLPGIQFAYNTLENEDMKMSSAYANYGYNSEKSRITLDGVTALQTVLEIKYL
jgi:hypothetical protein